MTDNAPEYDVDGPPPVDETEVELSDEVYAEEELVVNPPEDEPGPSEWDEPELDIPWYEKALDAIFDFFYKITRR